MTTIMVFENKCHFSNLKIDCAEKGTASLVSIGLSVINSLGFDKWRELSPRLTD